MRAPVVATAVTTVTVAPPSVGGTMFGISNAHLVQSLGGPVAAAGSAGGSVGLPPIKLDSLTGTGGSVRTKVNRASSICGPGPGMMLVSSLKSSGARSGTGSPVKRNSSSSSSFAGSGDRRSVFYTDTGPEQRHNKTTEVAWQPMANGAESGLTSEVNTTRASPTTATSGDAAKASTLADHPRTMTEQRRKSSPEELLQRLGDGQVRSKQQRPCAGAAGGLENAVIGRKAHLKLVSQELEWERKFRDDQLSRILKALICFENRLKSEQTRIRQQLYEKDDVINRQNCTINRMKRKLAADETGGPGEEDGDEVTQLCPKCRKNYYRLDCRTSGTQTFEYCRDDGAESVNTENLSLNSVEYASSSEEQESSLYVRANSFKDARRSRKYTSKRSYQGYPNRGASRACSFKSNASGPASAGGTLTRLTERNERVGSPVRFDELRKREREDDEGQTEETECGHEAYVNIEPSGQAVPKIVIYENYESDKENKRLDQNRRALECDSNNYDNVEPYSNRIDNLHGIQHRNGGPESRFGHGFRKQSLGGDDGRADTGSEQAMELDDGTIFYEANTSGGSVVGNQQKYTEGMEMKQTIETNDDWYASASDMEDSDTALGKPYSNAAVNPVLECVNQILLQQSMDGFGDSNGKDKDTSGGQPATNDEELYIGAQDPATTKNQQPPAAKEQPTQTTVRSKRVHFSTQNSMVQVPRISLQSCSRTSPSSKEDKMSPTYEIQSIYSNEYEPIGSEHNSYSNYYVDMESKLGSEDRERELSLAEKRKTPPALPPKPANLLKLQQLSKSNPQRQQVSMAPKGSSPTVAHSDIAESEPDYCSISEIQESVKCVQIVAEIHKDACEDDYSIVDEEETGDSSSGKPLELLEESFADVPKLPNVAEIVPPVKKTGEPLNKFISQDNYITKSISGSSAGGSPTKVMSSSGVGGAGTGTSVPTILTTPSKKDGEFREQLSEIIAEINKQSPAIRNASKKQVPVKELSPAVSTTVSFRGVATQIPGVTFQSKLKPVDKLSFLSKASSGAGTRSSLTHTPKLNIGRPAAIKPPMLKSSLSQKALSSTNLTLGTGNVLSPFGSPSKSSVSYIPNLKPSSLANGSPAKTVTPLKKINGTPSTGGPGMTVTTVTAPPPPVIIAEDSKLPIQAEFDWYNLDAEYGKSTNQPDVIVEADTSSNPEQESPTGSEAADGKRANSTPGEGDEKCPTKMDEMHDVAENGNEHQEEEMENALEYNLDEEYKSVTPIVPPPDIIQKAVVGPVTPPKNGKIPYNSLSFKELMQLNETPKVGAEKAKAKSGHGTAAATGTAESGPGTGNYEHFLDDSGLCSKPIILPRKKRVYYSGPFV